MPLPRMPILRASLATAALALLTACDDTGTFDIDMRGPSAGLDTTEAARRATAPRPQPDARGVISYPNYQVAVARRGDTVATVAGRLGLTAGDLARYNAVAPNAPLREGEILALPSRVAEPVAPVAPAGTPGKIDVTSLASGAINRAETGAPSAQAPVAAKPAGAEPIRHRVLRGETAYSIARAYNVSVRALADWNGLGGDLTVREGQYLLIPVADASRPAPVASVDASLPGQGSRTPEPPSASQPLPDEDTKPAAAATEKPASPDLGAERTAASAGGRLAYPVSGKIIRAYQKSKNEGIDIAAAAGTPVKAAEAGTVAAITQDTEQVPILVIRHEGGLLTVYANIEGITVSKGAKVSRGQTIAKVRSANPAFLHFEVRQGFDSVDPMPYLQ
ncbi:peptidoglycan DD-metalloendopeptidase family protein [Ostreiculturibacter nitratireducens]|uniref:peptidoglycan DD-metalloendopeptidase family protein n=1 Tax=Ostreiculturibacter nitratireducens TaxID=3075226 RepID=UPI0031B64FD6